MTCRFILSLINILLNHSLFISLVTATQQNPSPGSNQWSTTAVMPWLLRDAGENHVVRQCSRITNSPSEPLIILGNHLCVCSHIRPPNCHCSSKTPHLTFYHFPPLIKWLSFVLLWEKKSPLDKEPFNILYPHHLVHDYTYLWSTFLLPQLKVSCQQPILLLCIPSPLASWFHKLYIFSLAFSISSTLLMLFKQYLNILSSFPS